MVPVQDKAMGVMYHWYMAPVASLLYVEYSSPEEVKEKSHIFLTKGNRLSLMCFVLHWIESGSYTKIG